MARKKAAPRPRFKFIDLFSGIGGTRLALEAAGGKCVFSSEIDPSAVKTYYANFGDIPSGDVAAVDTKTIPPFDILCAGFPCQPFSHAGLKMGFDDTRGTLFFDIARINKQGPFIRQFRFYLVPHNIARFYSKPQRIKGCSIVCNII